MPELPEVETVCRGIKPLLENQSIKKILCRVTKLRYLLPKNLNKKIANCKILKVQRKAKYIQIFLDNETQLIIHLGMTGKLLIKKNFTNKRIDKHDHVIVELKNSQALVFNDVRKFGMLDLIDNSQEQNYKFFKDLGLEPLEKEFNFDNFKKIISHRNKSIKSTIMDSKLIVGVGNIYANESLFNAGIHPERISSDLKDHELELLRKEIIKILKKAIKKGGSTLNDFRNEENQKGYFQFDFRVYTRDGLACKICKTEIQRIKQNGRSSFVCSTCQK
jgi:formamidopyrimidine-DNA glycosylase